MIAQREKTIFLGCNGCGMKDLIRQKIFEDGYQFTGFLKKGRIAILEQNDKESMVMKITKDTNQMADEIRILLDITKKMKRESRSTIADIRNWGILVLEDFEPERQSQLLAYYTMPENQMMLHDYVNSQIEWQKIDTILDIGCQLINIIKDIHETGHSYNNMKHENVMINDGQVTLVGFGSARKIARPPQKGGIKTQSIWQKSRVSSVTKVDSCTDSLYNDIEKIYLLMISLLLKEKYSAFESFVSAGDSDICPLDFTAESFSSQQDMREHGKMVASYLTLEAARIQKLAHDNQPDKIDYMSFKKGILNRRMQIFHYLD